MLCVIHAFFLYTLSALSFLNTNCTNYYYASTNILVHTVVYVTINFIHYVCDKA